MRRWLVELVAGVAIAAVAYVAGMARAPRPPAQLEHQQELQLHELQLHQLALQRTEGPVHVVERWKAPAAPGCPPVERERVTDKGPVDTRQSSADASTRAIATRDVLRVVQAPPPRWAVVGGLQLLPSKELVLGAGVRLAGPIWLDAWARPRLELAVPPVGLQLRVEW